MCCYHYSNAQNIDTVEVTVTQFIEKGLQQSGRQKLNRTDVELAENKVVKARSNKFLPDAKLETRHSLVPAVKSDSILPNGNPLPNDELYLDPDLENDFNDLNFFTQGEVTAVQPLFGWGAIDNAIEAAQSGARAAELNFSAKKSKMKVQLFELYESYVLSLELERLVDEANEQLESIDKKFTKMQEEGNENLDPADFFKFKIFKTEFQTKISEVKQNTQFIKNTWDWILQSGEEQVEYIPAEKFLDPFENEIKSLPFYRQKALSDRYELNAIDETIEAAELGLSARRAQNLPMLFMGLQFKGAYSPGRPRQDNPFIQSNATFINAGFGLGIRQNLNFFSIKSDIQKSAIEYKKTKYLKDAAVDAIVMELNDQYKKTNIAQNKLNNSQEALRISKKWERQEQVDYDLGFGDPKNLLDAIKTKLELEVKVKRNIFDYNLHMAKLFNVSGMPLDSLIIN